ncbi:MAG: phage portal protein [Selenomonadaceae bacterium]|nr:phage portal protein [Selenomonadaceae bacterium]MBR1805829.1 phage portal protein [Selenomonadaceae bacterium]
MSGFSDGGASRIKKTLKAWNPRHWSAKEDIDANLDLLRNRAADLVMNSAIGHAAIQTQSTNVIGAGLKLFPRIRYDELGITADDARIWARHTKREFELWANDLHCDFLRRNNFYELQNIAFTCSLFDGDGFCLFKRRPASFETPYSLRLHLIDAQRVSNPIIEGFAAVSEVEMQATNSQNRIVNGIEVNRDGRLEAIWVCNKIWNEPKSLVPELKWQRVKVFGQATGCRNVLHICKDTRPDQFRGVPYLAPVVEMIKQMSRYADAELTSAIIKSFYSLFFTQSASQWDLNQIAGQNESDPNEPCIDASDFKLGSSTIAALPRGVDVKSVDSSNAQSTFEAFTDSFLTQIGAALNIPYELLVKKFQSSYSASRAALLQAADEFRQRKAAFVQDFCQPVYEQWLAEAVALGRISAPGFFDDPLTRSLWTSAAWYNERSGILDPVKETQAMILRLDAGLTTYSREIAESEGQDFDEVVATLAQEREMLSKILPPQTPEVNPDESTDDETDDADDDEDNEIQNARRVKRIADSLARL